MLKKLSFLFLLLLFIAPAFSEDTNENKTRGFQITEEEKNLPEWGPYFKALETKIKSNWHPPKNSTSKRIVVLFKIDKNGELLSTKIAKTSGSAENDQAAIDAVKAAAPFQALPSKYTGSSVEIDFTFDYSVFRKTDNLKAYKDSIKSKINKNWIPPEFDKPKVTVIKFEIGKQGELINTVVQNSSGDKDFDDSAVKAVRNTAPYVPLPNDYKDNSLTLTQTFFYKDYWEFYTNNVQSKIQAAWICPKEDKKARQATATFKIDKNGNLISVKLSKTSGDLVFDKAAIDAVKNASPFLPLPKSFKENFTELNYTFVYVSLKNMKEYKFVPTKN